jgi:hypothetical protein
VASFNGAMTDNDDANVACVSWAAWSILRPRLEPTGIGKT